MKLPIRVTGLACLLAFSISPQAVAQTAKSDDFKARMQKDLDAWTTLDPSKAAPFYAKDATLAFFDLAPLKYTGWNEYAEGVKKVLADFRSIQFALGPDVQTHRSGNTAWGTATVHLDMVTKDGSRQALDTRWTLIWKKRGKDWFIVHEHYSAPIPLPEQMAGQPLYKRLGGYDAIAAVVDEALPRISGDPQLSRFFASVSAEHAQRVRQLVIDYFCMATGGPCLYIGRDFKSTHAGLGISSSDWQKLVEHLATALDKFHVPAREKTEMLGVLGRLKDQIVEK